MDRLIERGVDLNRRWRAADYSHQRFAELAEQCLSDSTWREEVTLPAVVDWMASRDALPPQLDPGARFADAPISIFATPELSLDLLFWLDGTTSIHQHDFSGAFAVAFGSSLHCRYRFQARDRISERMAIGELQLIDVEQLAPGDVRRIDAEDGLIHSLYHLDRPTLSVVARTRSHAPSAPQLAYLRPHLAVDIQFQRELSARHQQVGQMLAQLERDMYLRYLCRLLQDCDFRTAYFLLGRAWRTLEQDDFASCLRVARGRHGARVDVLTPVFRDRQRQEVLVGLRRQVHDAELRFFLALLLNLHRRSDVIEQVRRRYPTDDPVNKLAHWSQQLFERAGDGAAATTATIVRELLVDRSDEAIVDSLSVDRSRVQRLADVAAVRQSELLRPLFAA